MKLVKFSKIVAQFFGTISLSLVLANCSQNTGISVSGTPAVILAINLNQTQILIANSCSLANTIETEDLNGNPTAVTYAQTVSLNSSSTDGSFYSDPACTLKVDKLTLAANTSSTTFYFKSIKAEYLTMTATTPNLQSVTVSQTIISPDAVNLSLTGSATLGVGACSTAFTVTTENSTEVPSNVTDDVLINLSLSGSGSFYSTPDCSGAAIKSVTVAANTQSQQFYYQSDLSGFVNITAQAPGPVIANFKMTVDSGAPSQLTFLTNQQSIIAGNCSSIITIQSQDQFGNEASSSTNETINLSGTGIQFFTDSACSTTPVTSLPLAAGANSISFYVSANSITANTITASGLGNQTQALAVSPAAASQLSMQSTTLPSPINAGAVIPNFNVQVQDQFGNPVTSSLNQVILSAYQDSSCSIPATSALSGLLQAYPQNGIAVFPGVNYTKAATIYIGASSSGLSSICSSEVDVTPNIPATLLITGLSTVQAGVCSQPISVTTTDLYGNVSPVPSNLTVTLSGNSKGSFYSTSNCSGTPINSLSIPASSSIANLYLKDSTLESLTLGFAGLGTKPVTKIVSVTAGPTSSLTFSGPASSTAGLCTSGFSLNTLDQFGNASPVASNFVINFSGLGHSSFYSDQSCTKQIISTTIPTGSSVQKVYFVDNISESLTIIATSSLNSPTISTIINPSTPASLGLNPPPTATAGVPFSSFQVIVSDQYGNLSPLVNENVTLNSFSDSACSKTLTPNLTGTTQQTSLNGLINYRDISYGTSQTIFIKATSASGLSSSCSSSISVLPGVVSKTLVSGPLYQNIDTCSQAFSVISTDSFGNVSPVSKNEVITLSNNGAGSFYATSSCSGSPVSNVTILANTTTVQFYYEDDRSEQITINAANPDLGTSTTLFSISPSAAVEIGFSGQSNLNAGQCSSAFLVSTEDDFGNKSNITNNITVNLSGGNGAFFSDINCTSSISSVQILSGTNSKPFYFKDSRSETVTISGSAVGMTAGSFSLSINALAPAQVTLTGPTTLPVGVCSNQFSINSLDQYGNATYATANQTFTSSGLGNAVLYSDSSCSTVLSSLILNAGSNNIPFYVQDTKSEALSFNFSSAIGNVSGKLTISPAPPSALVFESSQKSIIAGQCSPAITIQAQDQYGNPISSTSAQTLTLSGAGISYYTSPYCSGTPITTTQILSGASTVNVYVSSTHVSANLLSVAGFGTTASQAITILAADPSSLAFAVQPQSSIIAGVVFNPIKVQLLDQYTNIIQVANPITVKTYSDALCQTAAGGLNGTTQQLIVSGSATYSDLTFTVAQTIYFGASISGYSLTSCSSAVTVTPPTATKIAISPPNSTVSAGVCLGPISVITKDPFNNTSNATANTLVNLTNSGSGNYYSNNSCLAANIITSVTIPLGSNTETVYFSDTKAEAIYLIGATTNLSTTNYPLTVIPLAATKIGISGLTSFDSTVCSPTPFNVNSLDTYNNPSAVLANAIVTLGGSGNGSYFSDAKCSNAISNLTIANGSNDSQFYFLDNTKENLTLSFNSATLSAATYSLSILDPPATKLGLTGPASVTAGTCSTAYTVSTLQTSGVAAIAPTATSVALSGNGSGSFYSDSGCTTVINVVSILAGTTNSNFYFKDKTTESLFLVASSSPLTSAQITTQVGGAPIVKIVFGTITNTIAGQTIPVISAYYVDAFGNTSFSSASPISVSLQLSTGGAASSMTGTLTQDPVPGTTGMASFNDLSITKTGSYVLFASGDSVTGTSAIFTITAAAPNHFVKNVPSDNQIAYFNSALTIPIKATVQDIYNNPAPGISITFDPQASGGSFNPTSGTTLSDGTIQSTFTTGIVAGLINFQMVGTSLPTGNQTLPFTATDGPHLSASLGTNNLSGGNSTAISVTGWNYTCSTNSTLGSIITTNCLNYVAGYNYTGSPISEILTITSNWNSDVVTKTIIISPETTIGSTLKQGTNNAFGSSVAVYKNILAIGAPNDNTGGTACGAVYFYQGTYPTRTTNTWTFIGTLIPSYCQPNMHFGQSVSLYENLLAVGAPGENGPSDNLTNAGAVFVYLYNNTNQAFGSEVVLRQASPANNDYFGKAVSMSNNYLAASAPNKTVSSSVNAGQVSLFNLTSATNNTWASFQTINATTPIANSLYGSSLSLYSGFGSFAQTSFLAIGAPNVSSGGNVYVYESLNNLNFTTEFIRTASDSAAGNLYGSAITLFGPYLAIGSPGANTGMGATYVYKNITSAAGWAQTSTTNWSTEVKLQPATLSNSAAFGSSVAMFGNYLMSGAPGQNNGTAFVFQKSDTIAFNENIPTDWTSLDSLVASNGQSGDDLGKAVAIYDNRLVTGMQSNQSFQYTGNWSYNIWPFGFDGPLSVLSNSTINAGSVYDYSLVNLPSSYTLTLNATPMSAFAGTFIGSVSNIEIDGTLIGDGLAFGGPASLFAPEEDGTQNGEVLSASETALVGGVGGASGSPTTPVAGNNQVNGMGGQGASGNDGVNISGISGGEGGPSGTSGVPLYLKTLNDFMGSGTINLNAVNGTPGFVGSVGQSEVVPYTEYYDCSYYQTQYAPTWGNDNYVAWSCGGSPGNCLGEPGCGTANGTFPNTLCEPFGNSPTNCQFHPVTDCPSCWYGTFSGEVYTYSCDVLIPQTCSTPSTYVAYTCGGGGGGGGAGGSGGDLFVRYKTLSSFNPSDIFNAAGVGGVGGLGGAPASGGSCTGSSGLPGVNGVVGTYSITQFE